MTCGRRCASLESGNPLLPGVSLAPHSTLGLLPGLQTHRSPPGFSERLWDRFTSPPLEPSPMLTRCSFFKFADNHYDVNNNLTLPRARYVLAVF